MGKEPPPPPLTEFVRDDRKRADVREMEKYAEIFFSIEYTILIYWKKHPKLKDKEVISAFKKLKYDFDSHKEQSLAGTISHSVKAMLAHMMVTQKRIYTYGEIISCVSLLKRIAKMHKAPHGRGYLYWVRTFFEGELPETQEEILEYILKYES